MKVVLSSLALSLFVSCVACLGGCAVGPLDIAREVLGPSRAKLAACAFDRDADADLRREAVNKMARRYWGHDKAALEGYARLAATREFEDGRLEDATVRCAALRALGGAGDKAVEHVDEIVIALLDPSDVNVRWDAAAALDKVVTPAAVEYLAGRARKDPSPDVRCASVRALRHYRTTRVAGVLIQCMDDGDYAVRKRAHESLVEIAGKDLGDSPADWVELIGKIPPPPPQRRPWWRRLF